ncbi:MAG: Spy/CpxP family protein refolding chaperone [Phormidesmis sp.]
MKRQFGLFFLSAASILTLATVAMAEPFQKKVANPLSSNIIQTSSESATAKARRLAPVMLKGRSGNPMSKIEDLDLTAEQKVQLEEIQDNITMQMSEVLTPQQVQDFTDAQADGGSNMRSLFMSLDGDQRSAVMGIMRSAQSDMMAILTPDQRAQIQGSSPRDRN